MIKQYLQTLKPLFTRFLIILFLFLICVTPASYALTVKDVPNPRQEYGGWVSDMADMLSPSAEKQINFMISHLESKTQAEIAVVTVPETQPSPTVKVFATELFNTWHIGKKAQDNGVLFLISQGDRRIEIETGYGVQNILSDANINSILHEQVTPLFREGNYQAGILAGTKELVRELSLANYVANPSPELAKTLFFCTLTFLAGLIAGFWLSKKGIYSIVSSLNIHIPFSSNDGISSGSDFGGGDSGGGGGGDSW